MGLIKNLVRLSSRLVREPHHIHRYSEQDHNTPILLWVLAGLLLLVPTAFLLPLKGAALMTLTLAVGGVLLLGVFWMYSTVVLMVGKKMMAKRVTNRKLALTIGLCFAPVLVGGVINVLVGLVSFVHPTIVPFLVILSAEAVGFLYLLWHGLRKIGSELFVFYVLVGLLVVILV